MVLGDGTSSVSSSMCIDSWEDSSKNTVDLVSDFEMLSLTAITAERTVLNPIQFIEQEMDDVYVSEADSPFKDVFLHNHYKEATDSTVFFTMEEEEEPFSSKDIFKVWPLDALFEEDEFSKLLGLSQETPSALPKSSNDDSELLGDLAVGVADISLNRHS